MCVRVLQRLPFHPGPPTVPVRARPPLPLGAAPANTPRRYSDTACTPTHEYPTDANRCTDTDTHFCKHTQHTPGHFTQRLAQIHNTHSHMPTTASIHTHTLPPCCRRVECPGDWHIWLSGSRTRRHTQSQPPNRNTSLTHTHTDRHNHKIMIITETHTHTLPSEASAQGRGAPGLQTGVSAHCFTISGQAIHRANSSSLLPLPPN